MSTSFFTADWHLGHDNIIKFCHRPFSDSREMIEALIRNHNAKVSAGDICYFVGDLFWRTLTEGQCIDILNRLNGQHAFIWGNHDERIEESPAIQSKFVFVRHVAQIDTKVKGIKQKIWLSHYAHRVWPSSHKGSWHLYGHSHAALPEILNRSFDVGVDSSPNYSPFSLEEVAERMQKKIDMGAHDPLKPQIDAEPWNKGEIPPPQVPAEVWKTLEDEQKRIEGVTGSGLPLQAGRCIP